MAFKSSKIMSQQVACILIGMLYCYSVNNKIGRGHPKSNADHALSKILLESCGSQIYLWICP